MLQVVEVSDWKTTAFQNSFPGNKSIDPMQEALLIVSTLVF